MNFPKIHCRLVVVVTCLFIIVLFASCEDDIFGPRTFEGEWRVTEYDKESVSQSFLVVINYFPGDSSRLVIDNFSNLGRDYAVVASVSNLSLTVPLQSVDGRGGRFSISGSGSASSNLRKIDWIYRIDNGNYTAIFEK